MKYDIIADLGTIAGLDETASGRHGIHSSSSGDHPAPERGSLSPNGRAHALLIADRPDQFFLAGLFQFSVPRLIVLAKSSGRLANADLGEVGHLARRRAGGVDDRVEFADRN
ncbi:MAG: hypothetical protein ACHRXM_11180 [Isosphaerales bacterium]